MFFYLVEPIGFELPTIALFAVFEHFFSCCVCREVILQSFDGNVTVAFRCGNILVTKFISHLRHISIGLQPPNTSEGVP